MEWLDKKRVEMDAIDAVLVEALEKRIALSREIAEYKRSHKMPIYDPSREQHIFDKCVGLLQDPQYAKEIIKIYEQVLHQSRDGIVD